MRQAEISGSSAKDSCVDREELTCATSTAAAWPALESLRKTPSKAKKNAAIGAGSPPPALPARPAAQRLSGIAARALHATHHKRPMLRALKHSTLRPGEAPLPRLKAAHCHSAETQLGAAGTRTFSHRHQSWAIHWTASLAR